MGKVIVTIIGTQTDASGDENRLELVTAGTRHDKNGISYVTYHESEISGMEGTTTLLKVFGDHFALIRKGAVEQHLEFYPDRKCDGRYITAFGAMSLSVYTKRLDMVSSGKNLSLDTAYELAINDQWQSSNTLSVSVLEEE